MKRLFFAHRVKKLDPKPPFANLVFPSIVLVECDGRVIAHGLYLGNLTVVTNSPLCDGSNYRVHFNDGLSSRAVVTHRVPHLELCYMQCFASPVLPYFRRRHNPVVQGTFVFEVSILPNIDVRLALAGEQPAIDEDEGVWMQHYLYSGSMLASRHGEIIGMLIAQIENQPDYTACVHIDDIVAYAHAV